MTTLTPDLLARIGRALYGDQWQSALARDLGISRETIKKILAGKRSINPRLAGDLLNLCVAHAQELADVAGELRRIGVAGRRLRLHRRPECPNLLGH